MEKDEKTPEAEKQTAPVNERPKHVRDGYKIKSLPPMNKVAPYIMKDRVGSSLYFTQNIDITNMEAYIRKKRSEGLKGFGALHVLLAAYVRTVSQLPGINRFIRGQKIYARNFLEIVMTIKKELSLNSMETLVKIYPKPTATSKDIFELMTSVIEENRAEAGDVSGFDRAARLFNFIPGVLLAFAIGFLRFLDYFGLLPRILTTVSPFHASMIITSMGSLGIPPIYHHLYNFGNIPVFISYGAKYTKYEMNKDGVVEQHKYIDLSVVLDERICDGHYYATAFKQMNTYLQNPDVLDTPPETVVPDLR